MKRGLFCVLEGVDGAGSTTQRNLLVQHILGLNKYNNVLGTREPWDSDEIRARLEGDKDAYSGGERMAELYVTDRLRHTQKVILPLVNQGVHVVSDRYSISSCAYQWTQGVDLKKLIEMHKNHYLLKPNVTFFVDVDAETALSRIESRGEEEEKFEQREFMERLVDNYRNLVAWEDFFGRVICIDGTQPIEAVAADVSVGFADVYDRWGHILV